MYIPPLDLTEKSISANSRSQVSPSQSSVSHITPGSPGVLSLVKQFEATSPKAEKKLKERNIAVSPSFKDVFPNKTSNTTSTTTTSVNNFFELTRSCPKFLDTSRVDAQTPRDSRLSYFSKLFNQQDVPPIECRKINSAILIPSDSQKEINLTNSEGSIASPHAHQYPLKCQGNYVLTINYRGKNIFSSDEFKNLFCNFPVFQKSPQPVYTYEWIEAKELNENVARITLVRLIKELFEIEETGKDVFTTERIKKGEKTLEKTSTFSTLLSRISTSNYVQIVFGYDHKSNRNAFENPPPKEQFYDLTYLTYNRVPLAEAQKLSNLFLNSESNLEIILTFILEHQKKIINETTLVIEDISEENLKNTPEHSQKDTQKKIQKLISDLCLNEMVARYDDETLIKYLQGLLKGKEKKEFLPISLGFGAIATKILPNFKLILTKPERKQSIEPPDAPLPMTSGLAFDIGANYMCPIILFQGLYEQLISLSARDRHVSKISDLIKKINSSKCNDQKKPPLNEEWPRMAQSNLSKKSIELQSPSKEKADKKMKLINLSHLSRDSIAKSIPKNMKMEKLMAKNTLGAEFKLQKKFFSGCTTPELTHGVNDVQIEISSQHKEWIQKAWEQFNYIELIKFLIGKEAMSVGQIKVQSQTCLYYILLRALNTLLKHETRNSKRVVLYELMDQIKPSQKRGMESLHFKNSSRNTIALSGSNQNRFQETEPKIFNFNANWLDSAPFIENIANAINDYESEKQENPFETGEIK